MVNDIAVQEFVKAIKETPQDTNRTYNATVSHVDDEGVVWVNIHGSDMETPTASTSTEVKRGDAVTVNWRNNKLYIAGNYSNPSAGVVRVASVEQNAEDARLAAEAAEYNARLAQSLAEQNAITMANTVIEINNDIADLQNQIDGNITTWFYDYQPTTSNAPASTWTTVDEKNNHLGDLFYDTATGYAYRWMSNGASTPTFSWSKITDTDVTTALATALAAQDTADHKRRVFITTPTVPYDVGDLWCEGTTGDILTCTHARTEVQSYTSSDWAKLNKYTDDTRADEAYSLANTAKVSADGKNKIYRQATQPSDGTYVVGDIWFDTSHSNKIYRYSGSAWVAVTLGDDALDSLSANKLTAGTIDASIITVSNLDAGNITTGNLAADRMKVNSITAINSNTGTVKIAASKVEIDGTATFNAIKPSTDATYDAIGAASDVQTALQTEIDAKKSTWNLMSTSASGATYQAILGYAESTTTFTIDNSASGFDKATDVKVGDTVRLKYKATNMGSDGTYVYIIGKATQVPPTVASNEITLDGRGLDTTVIDGSHILTGTIDADRIGANSITASKMRIGDYNNYITATENDPNSILYGTISDGWIYKNNASASNIGLSPIVNNWTKLGEKYRVTGVVKIPSDGKIRVAIQGRRDNNDWVGNNEYTVNVSANVETSISGIITINSTVADCAKCSIAIYFHVGTTGSTYQVGYCKKMRLERMANAELIVDGSITTNALTVGARDAMLNDNIQVGGRNLIRVLDESKLTVNKLRCSYTYDNGTYVIKCTTAGGGSSFTQIYGETGNGALAFNGVSPGDTVIFHADSVVSSNSASEPRIYLDMRKADGTYISSVGIYQSLNNWVNIFTIPAEVAKYTLIVRLDQNKNAAVGDTLTVSGIKLEKGNKATDWTPAPEDVQNDIALSNRNMLLDWNASSLDKVDASSARYYGNNATDSAYITPTFIPINDAPEPSIKYGVRFVGNGTNTAVTSLTLCFYSAQNLTALPFKDGCKYTISFWARCTAGNSRISIMVRNGTAWEYLIPTSTVPTSEWKRYYGVLDYRTADYNRLHFYIYFDANKSGTVETCGFQCVANGDSAEATKYITAIDNNGIRVHAANNPTSNYAKIDASGMEVYKGGNKVAKFGQTIELSDGTRTLYEVKPLSGAAKVTRLYNLAYYDGYTERETYYETVHLGRTVSSWSSIILAYKINSTSYTKSYTSFPVSDTSGKFTLSISYADSSNARVNVGINANTTLASTETLTIESLTFNYATTQVAIESTLGAFADKTQSAAFRVGNGTATNATSNSFSLDWAGNGYFNGDIYANCNANSSGGVSLGTVQYIPSAFNADTTEYYMDIGVFRIGMVVMLDISFFRNKSIAAGANIFNLDISRSDIPMPQTGVATGMAFYNNGTSSRALGIVLGDTDGTGPRIRVYNNGTNAVTISSTQEVRCTMTYICDTFTAAHWDEV